MKRSAWILFIALIVVGFVAVPVGAYVAGGRLAGPYAGPRGLASFLGAIYADAVRGRLLALTLLLGPLLAVSVWPLRAWLLSRPMPENDTVP
jgi:hypothetical protein